mgnify:CR=1 FL=1
MSKSQHTSGRQNGGQQSEPAERKRPCHVIRRWCGAGNVDVAIFDKDVEVEGRDGSMTTFYVSVTKSYRDRDGKYQSVSLFNPHELLILAHAVQEAYDWINEAQNRDGQSSSSR